MQKGSLIFIGVPLEVKKARGNDLSVPLLPASDHGGTPMKEMQDCFLKDKLVFSNAAVQLQHGSFH